MRLVLVVAESSVQPEESETEATSFDTVPDVAEDTALGRGSPPAVACAHDVPHPAAPPAPDWAHDVPHPAGMALEAVSRVPAGLEESAGEVEGVEVPRAPTAAPGWPTGVLDPAAAETEVTAPFCSVDAGGTVTAGVVVLGEKLDGVGSWVVAKAPTSGWLGEEQAPINRATIKKAPAPETNRILRLLLT
jgi:hypothetical protein